MARSLKPEEVLPRASRIYATILAREGPRGFYRGLQANVMRNAMVNVGEMASYDQIKQNLKQHTFLDEGVLLHLCSAFIAGFIATIVASPFDVVKTRVMSSPDSYSGVINCFQRTIREEGLLAFYNGFVANFTRLGIWTCVTFVTMEQIKMALTRG
eukprot:CAMPEP_0202963100 /NCGR_PEP_ID=MMETSP1396-20130829/7092_1 /ASSEMBLY_ACC=CAM_ASM_000872 /TAXON_ID= /ORGANISM="Pseudokeronopsis sp., Strain Brazil" /LENGTH=155 /DNA_ID=CAMNT_0049684043 /DNA_START=447 /DNA_END=914 /DNA_ORIENTATION=+